MFILTSICFISGTGSVQVTASLHDLLAANAGQSRSFLFRTADFDEGGTSPSMIRDGILTVRYEADCLGLEQLYTELRAEDGYREVHRSRIVVFDALTGESAMRCSRFDSVDETVYLEHWEALPGIFHHAVGLLAPGSLPAGVSTTLPEGESLFQEPASPVRSALVVEAGRLQHCESRSDDGSVLGRISFEGFVPASDGRAGGPSRIVEGTCREDGSLRSAGVYQLVEPVSGGSALLDPIPTGTRLMDLRQRHVQVSSVPTDRLLTLRQSLTWPPIAAGDAAVSDVESPQRTWTNSALLVSAVLVSALACVLLKRSQPRIVASSGLLLLPLQAMPDRPGIELHARVLAALQGSADLEPTRCDRAEDGVHRLALRSSMPGSNGAFEWLLPRHTGGPWLAPLSGRFSLYVLDARCVVCGSAEDPRRFAFQRAAADVRLELSRPVVLRVGPDGIGRGSIALRSGTSEPIVLVDLSRHCALRQSLALPLHIGAETVELPLEWNARNPVELPRQPFLFHDPDGVVGMCRIELTWDVEPPRVAPARLRFANSRSIEVTVEGGGFHISAVETADAPPCLRVGSFVRKGSRWTAAVHEERMARERHSCGAWILHLISPAGEPFERRLGVEHDPRMQGPEGEPSLFARLTPGERIWILRRSDGTLGLAMPERLPCIDETMLRESRVIADFTAPVDTGRFAATVGTPEGAVAIAGVVQGAEEALQLGWWKLAGVTVLR